MAAYQAEARAAKRSAVAAIKLERGCADCGYNTHPAALDFDHLQDKTFAISRMVGKRRTMEDIMTEIEKCEVVCANCHRIRTDARRGGGA